jgi:hypothetical protein
MILEGVLLHDVGEHTMSLDVVGGGELEGDGNDGADAGECGSERLESSFEAAARSVLEGGGGTMEREEQNPNLIPQRQIQLLHLINLSY